MNHNWKWIDPSKIVHILKNIFQYFYDLVFRLHRFLRCVILFTLHTFCWGRQYLNISYIPLIFYCCQQFLFTLRVSSLLSLLIHASVDIVDDKGSLQFSPETKFISPLHTQITLVTDTEAE